jgi:hypothetical protein
MTLPARIDQRDLRGKPKLRSPAHRDWVRSHYCSVDGCCEMPIECAHVRRSSNAGTGIKSSDAYCLSLCREHHRESHRGEQTFERKYKIDLMAKAREFYERSPFKSRLDNPWGGK